MIRSLLSIFPILLFSLAVQGQAITGVWRGKISKGLRQYSLELKLVRNGDSLSGTSYYYASASQYARFSVRGYFDPNGDIVWWDRELLDSKGSKLTIPNNTPFRFAADFNCPGNDIMMLDGTADKGDGKEHEVHLSKVKGPMFRDEWDEVIDDFPYWAGVPGAIDSVEGMAARRRLEVVGYRLEDRPAERTQETGYRLEDRPAERTQETGYRLEDKPKQERTQETGYRLEEKTKTQPSTLNTKPSPSIQPSTLSITDLFKLRKQQLVTTIPVDGDSITLDFYDNAEIDGDSISLFLNGKLIHQHVLLKAQPFQFKIAVSALEQDNDLVMVAENLGSIPPNTSLMIVYVNGVRYEARLESDEGSSALIRFTKKSSTPVSAK